MSWVENRFDMRYLAYGVFALFVSLVTYTLVSEHSTTRWLFTFYPFLMFAALFANKKAYKSRFAVASLAILLGGGMIEPFELDAVEEAFILIPLSYVMLFPGSLWPIASAVLLCLSYLYQLPEEDFDEFIEDAIELVAITVFASLMVYYQVKLKLQMERYQRDSFTDFSTGVLNRTAFYHQLDIIQQKDDADYALMLIDVDDFKYVNDSLGHSTADKILIDLAQRLKSLLPSYVTLYRLGGDEFVVLVKGEGLLGDRLSCVEFIFRNDYIAKYPVNKATYKVTFSTGVALLEDASNDVELWCKNVDIALKRAKSLGAGSIQWYDSDMLSETVRAHQIEKEITYAIEESQFSLAYQPKVSTDTNQLMGAEALLRWVHPELGVISPVEFIAIAEKSTQIVPIGRWVINEACRQGKEWLQQGHQIAISINVSTVQFVHDDVYKVVSEALVKHAFPAHFLEVEITETTLMKQYDKVVENCNKLRKLGVTVAVDDFGVAYSSLNYLKRLPIDVLKIDKSFIDECVEVHTDHMLVKTIIQMGQNMGKRVVAEGVETAKQLSLLQEEQCDWYQGYLFSKPLYPDEFSKLLDSAFINNIMSGYQ
ncbi:bifunctional diguanylate cyclase/phosphodiesterase [Vibrio sp. SCSIO 43135]|nr:bifunctional diguanylate cyclase/phosphodiesterase [Vibrio sp. SCSIO 43135]